MKSFRVIVDGPRHPLLNMALDIVLMDRASRGEAVLRIYQWMPPAVSIGRRQELENTVNTGKAREKGYIPVRRPTGGAALVHDGLNEVTYSIVIPSGSYIYELGVDESSTLIAAAVADALNSLGVPVNVGGFKGLESEENFCFLRSGFADLVLNGRKISGSAQYRDSRGLLQHGSILLHYNPSLWSSLIKHNASYEHVENLVTGLLDEGYKLNLESITESLIAGFSELVGMSPEYSHYSVAEVSKAVELVERGHGIP